MLVDDLLESILVLAPSYGGFVVEYRWLRVGSYIEERKKERNVVVVCALIKYFRVD